MTDWLALVIGNTRWHWSWFHGSKLKQVWHTFHLWDQTLTDSTLRSFLEPHVPFQLLELPVEGLTIWAVSVVPDQAQTLQHLSNLRWIHRVPLANTYTTMGLDRSITLWGAGQQYGWPVLVIDAGTALTFTAGVHEAFVGGAILLGVRSHLMALHQHTAALPSISATATLPPRWARNTPDAIQSGVIYTLLDSIQAYITSWQQQHTNTAIIFTGGDGDYLYKLYRQQQTQQNQALSRRTWSDSNLMFWGIRAYRNEATRAL